MLIALMHGRREHSSSASAQSVKVNLAMGEHDMAVPIVTGDEQQVRAAHADPFGALVRRQSMAPGRRTVFLLEAPARRVWALGAQIDQSIGCAARQRQRHAAEPICRHAASSEQHFSC